MNESEIGQEIEKRAVGSVRKWMDNKNSKRWDMGYHVSSFVYNCVRKVWYEKKVGRLNEVDDDGLMRMWIGTKLHETPLSDNSEVPFMIAHDNTIFGGTLDELMIVDGKKIIIDKKFSARLPKQANDHYIEQVMFYAALMAMSKGEYVDGVGILYILPVVDYYTTGKERMRTFIKLVSHAEIDAQADKIRKMIEELNISLKNDTLPTPTPGWICKYCDFLNMCNANVKTLEGLNLNVQNEKSDAEEV